MDLARLTDDELLARTPERPEAFGAFYARHERAVVAWFHRRTGDPELAADLTAEAFAAALLGARAAALLERLSPDQAHAVRAHVIDEVPYERLAAELECSASVVRKRVSRGLAVLREFTEERS